MAAVGRRRVARRSAGHPDGKVLAFQQATPPAKDIMLLTIDGNERDGWRPGRAARFFDGGAIELAPAFSPDGRWLAYSSWESGRAEIHMRPFPGPGSRVVVSRNGGRSRRWSPTARQLFYAESVAEPTRLMVVDYAADGGTFQPEAPRPWSGRRIMPRRNNHNYALHPDGRRVAALVEGTQPERPSGADRLAFVSNPFLDELRRLAPTGR